MTGGARRVLALGADPQQAAVLTAIRLPRVQLAAVFAQLADRVLVLRDGRMLAQGAARDVLSPALIAEAFAVAASVLAHPLKPVPLIATAQRSALHSRRRRVPCAPPCPASTSTSSSSAPATTD